MARGRRLGGGGRGAHEVAKLWSTGRDPTITRGESIERVVGPQSIDGAPGAQVIDDAGTELLSAAAADALAHRFVAHLAAGGHPPGTRVVFQAPNSADLLAAVYGALCAGYLPVVISAALTDRERSELIADVAPCVVADADLLAEARHSEHRPARALNTHPPAEPQPGPGEGPPGRPGTTPEAQPHVIAPIARPGAVPVQAYAAPGRVPVPRLTDWFRCRPMHFTSGTSGRPKGVWSGWLAEQSARDLVAEEVAAWDVTPADRHLVCGPMSHSAPLRFPLMTLARGGEVVIPRGFDPHVIGELIEAGAATTTFMAPTHLQRLLDARPPRGHRMRLVAHAGSSCPAHVRRRARAAFGDDVLREFYGSTEGQFTVCTPAEFDAHPGTVGRARPDRSLRVDDEGLIWCRVPGHARFTYWNDPGQTAQAWDGDWFTVRDLGRLDQDGYLYLDGRRSDLIITGGVNVYPAELERVVLELPAVRQAVAVGADDPDWGQRVCLWVVGDATEAEVREHCRRELAPAKRPKIIRLVDELPLTHNGKVDRLRLATER